MLLADILDRQAATDPGRVALIEGERRIGFGELAARARGLADALTRIARPGDRVAVLARNRIAYVDCYYGVPAAGMILTMLNFRLHPREWAWIVADAGARVLVVEQCFLEAVEEILPALGSVAEVLVIDARDTIDGRGSRYRDFEEFLGSGRPDAALPPVTEDTAAWLLYTSGTTGFPKGAVLTHRNVLTSVTQSALEFRTRPDDRMLMSFPLCHVAGYAVPRVHLLGGTVILTAAFEPAEFARLVERHRVTLTALAPTMLIYLLRDAGLAGRDLSSLRAVGFGSANLPYEVLRAGVRRFGPVFFSGFGMTELGGDVLVLPRDVVARAAEEDDESLLRSCGRPMCLASVRIVDEDLRDVPTGAVGEIVVRSDQVTREYWNNPSATREAWRGGWFHTGDLARRDAAGFVTIVDRSKDMIITGGENVYSREVEDAVAAVPGVVEAAVVGVPDPVWGESVAVVIVAEPGVTLDADEVVAHCRGRLARFKVPRRVLFVDELPKNGTGKVLKHRLRETIGSVRPGSDRRPRRESAR